MRDAVIDHPIKPPRRQFLKGLPEELPHIFETIRQPLLILDGSSFEVRLANHWFFETFHVTKEETIGQLVYELGNGQWNIPQLRFLLESVLVKQESFDDFEVKHYFERIGTKTMLLNARKVRSGGFILLAFEDVTERLRSDAELKRSNEELKQFANVASHDLKEPIRMVKNYLQLLERHPNREDEEAKRFIRFAMDGADRMSALIDNLLIYANLGKQQKLAQIDLNDAFQSAVTNLEPLIAETRASVKRDELPTIKGDSTEFVQLFQNLITNAITYRGKDLPIIHTRATKHEGEWILRVEDNGMGIDPKDQESIFQMFKRLHSRSEYPGVGLGLATCKKIVEGHDGRIWVESQLGTGSTFFFTLPV